ncbi:MAG: hypothetical protein N3E48_00055 [Candidatus Bathyarchaeota archaeon]|nr:hypothetical protein [Candidatus Bathyarchaeota archaeon]
MDELLKKFACYIPKSERIKLFNYLYKEYGFNTRAIAKELGISLRRVYFYLPKKESKKVRNYPSDYTTYLMLKTLIKKNQLKAYLFLKNIQEELNKLESTLFLRGVHSKVVNLYDMNL